MGLMSVSRRPWIALWAAITLAVPATLQAQEPPASIGLKEVQVTAGGKSARVRYKHYPAPGSTDAIIYLHGDLPNEEMRKAGKDEAFLKYFNLIEKRLQKFSAERKLQTVMIARPGYIWSSGDARERRTELHYRWIREAIVAIVGELRIERYALAGQSGGSTAAAMVVALGDTATPCVILGSGGYSWIATSRHQNRVFDRRPLTAEEEARGMSRVADPIQRVRDIAVIPARRFVLLADPRDKRTPFAAQVEFWSALRGRGHDAKLVVRAASGAEFHSMSNHAMSAAETCLAETRSQPRWPAPMIDGPAKE
ncbi:MAG TPA: hypothetical protein PK264_09605 [Hyphomicrobiaceae bacterium]|nr:hypothetical protein [Hyphomicrobiaceae bacterium]